MSVNTPRGQTCQPWASPSDLTTPCTSEVDLDAQLVANCLQIATDVLYNLTRRRWTGLCTETISPPGWRRCPVGAAGAFIGTGRFVTSDGMPIGGIHHGDRASCGCGYVSTLKLPGPVYYNANDLNDALNPIVFVDGVQVPTDEYRIDDHNMLVGLRNHAGTLRIWPVCQRLDLPVGSVGTWTVTYTRGRKPPQAAIDNCATLACELAIAKQPPGSDLLKKSRLPKRTTMNSRAGNVVAVLDPEKMFQDGQTGIPEIDLWVASLLIGDDDRVAAAWDPARSRNVRRTGR